MLVSLWLAITVSFDYYIFSRSWAPTVRNSTREDFVIHGLWPNWNNGSWPSYCDTTTLNQTAIRSLQPDMITHWTDTTTFSKTNVAFWNHEWTKHGTCSDHTQLQYFAAALWVGMRSDPNLALQNSNITPSTTLTYPKTLLEQTFSASLYCEPPDTLAELRVEVSRDFAHSQMVSTPSTCTDMIYLRPLEDITIS